MTRHSETARLGISGILLALAAGVGRLAAEEPAGDSASERKPPSGERDETPRLPPIFYLRDGSRVAGMPRLERVSVQTRYGLLEIPLPDVVMIRLAARIDPAEVERIRAAIGDLGSPEFDVRERAMGLLRESGASARRFIREAARSPDEEVRNRAAILLGESGAPKPAQGDGEEFEAILDDDDDEVVAQRFTVRGRVLLEKIRVGSSFGDLEIPAGDVLGIVFTPATSASRSLSIQGSNTAPDAWLNTRVNVSKGLRLAIHAKGSLMVPNYNLTAGPEGTRQYAGATFENFPMLALVGKIGKNGKPFLVAREYQGKAPREGTLFLAVVPFRRNYMATGTYQVRIEARP